MAGLTNIKNQALTERIEDHLFQYILDGHLAVGAKLPNEYELADRFGVSRGTIREAVKLLVSRGVLRVKHGSGTYVASLMPLKADPLGLDAIEDRIQLALDLTGRAADAGTGDRGAGRPEPHRGGGPTADGVLRCCAEKNSGGGGLPDRGYAVSLVSCEMLPQHGGGAADAHY